MGITVKVDKKPPLVMLSEINSWLTRLYRRSSVHDTEPDHLQAREYHPNREHMLTQ